VEIGYLTVESADCLTSSHGDVHAHNIKKEGRIFVLGKRILVSVIDLRGAEFEKEYTCVLCTPVKRLLLERIPRRKYESVYFSISF